MATRRHRAPILNKLAYLGGNCFAAQGSIVRSSEPSPLRVIRIVLTGSQPLPVYPINGRRQFAGRIVIRHYESIGWRVTPSAAGSFRMHAMLKLPVVPICRRDRRLPRRANQNDLLGHPASMKRDVRALVTTREAGMRWTRMARQTNVADVDGEVAWSRPPDAEVKSSWR